MQFNNSLLQGGLGLLAGSMPNSGFSPWAAGLQGAQSGMAMDRDAEARRRWEALIAGQGGGQGPIPNPASMTAGIPPINQAGGPIPQAPGGVPSSASLRQRFAQQPGQAGFPGAAAPSAQPSVASTSRGQGLGSEYWREFGLRKPPGAPAGAPPALTAARGGPAGVQVAALGPMGGGGAARGSGGGAVTLAPQAQPQQALGVSPGPGTGLQGLLASLDPTTRQMVAQLGPEQGAPLLMSMLAQRNKTTAPPADVAEYQYAKSNGFQGSYLDFKRELAQTTATPTAPKQQPIQILQAARDALPQGDPNRAELQTRINKLNAPTKGQTINVGGGEIGTIPPGWEVFTTASGGRSMRPIAGGPVAQEMQAEAAAAEAREGTQLQTDLAKAETMLGATSGIKEAFESANTPVTGTGSIPFAQFSSTPAGRVRSYVNTLQSGSVLGAMQELKKASSSGATGFGALNEKELDLLIASVGALEPNTTEEDIFLDTVDRIEGQYSRVIADIKANVSPEKITELGLEELIAKAEFGIRPEDTPENQALIANIPPANERNIGTWYQTPRGRALWTGEGWRLE